jgi:histidine triad (HIT) family protein
MGECLFCRIINGETPATILHQDPRAIAFRDINPQAPVHILVIPRQHIESLDEAAAPEDEGLLGHLLLVGAELARKEGLSAEGYRTVVNTGAAAGQTVYHIHVHILGGRGMDWPPG